MKRLSDAKAMQINGGSAIDKVKAAAKKVEEWWNNSSIGKFQKKVRERDEMIRSLLG